MSKIIYFLLFILCSIQSGYLHWLFALDLFTLCSTLSCLKVHRIALDVCSCMWACRHQLSLSAQRRDRLSSRWSPAPPRCAKASLPALGASWAVARSRWDQWCGRESTTNRSKVGTITWDHKHWKYDISIYEVSLFLLFLPYRQCSNRTWWVRADRF